MPKRGAGLTDPVDADHSLVQCFSAEFIGTFMLTFVSVGASVTEMATGEPIELAAKAAARGLIVTVMIYTLGGISGAHLNPAVTLAFAARRAFPWVRAPLYWAGQLAGALAGAGVLLALFGPALSAGVNHPGPGIAPWVAFATEAILALLLVSVILGTAEEARLVGPNAAIAVGGTIALCGFFADPVSGASMNTFRSFAPALLSGKLDSMWIYALAPFIGALGATGLAWYFHGPPNESEQKASRGPT